MPNPPSNQVRAQRMDRFMAFLISGGGLLIIGAVLAMLLFIMKESVPLFIPPQSKSVGSLQAPRSGGAWVDESGKAIVLLSQTEGLKALRVPEGTLLPVPGDGPALPWRMATPPSPRGESLVLGGDGRLFLAQLAWSKPAGENDPAQWTLEPHWQGGLKLPSPPLALLHFRIMEAGGLGGGSSLRVVARTAEGLAWFDAALDAAAPLAWKPLQIDPSLHPSAAIWSADGQHLFVGTREGRLLDLDPETSQVESAAEFGEPVQSLGFALGQSSLLVGGARGKLAAYQRVRVNEVFTLQAFHRFPALGGPVLGFQAGQRDKRFLAWAPTEAVVDHLTTERRLFSAPLEGAGIASLAPRGDLILHANEATGALHLWSLDAPHPEVSFKLLWGKTHYEGYEKPEYVWQSTGGTDDFEPKFSLVPLVFGTLKGTLYAMLFAFPLAVLGALYTSQFATPRLRNTIKPAVEIMAALPSVVLGFLAGLVMAPLLERMAVEVFIYPFVVLFLALLIAPFWGRLPRPFRNASGTGREVLWMVPVLLLAVAATHLAGPWVERVAMGGSYRTWLQTALGVTYDQRNSLVVGFAMGFAVIPIIFTISEDALSSVPKSLTSASLACGASPWQTAWRIVLPTASPGIFSATMVGLGRAIGETMIVLMATGNTPIMDWGPFNGMRTLSANIAVEIPEAPLHGTLYRVLFLAAFLLFVLTFILNTVAELVRQRLRRRYESI
ncbi:MAG TPA: ABC transporter permease subunit [Geothrix sp.]|nr:ABC transporter permease subunit [Geothrix sp.]